MASKYQKALVRQLKAEADALAEFMDEYTLEGTPVTDDFGNPMSKAQVVQAARDSWREEVRKMGLNPENIY